MTKNIELLGIELKINNAVPYKIHGFPLDCISFESYALLKFSPRTVGGVFLPSILD